jgi:general secretion pathway protein B
MSLLLEALKKSEDERAQRRNESPLYAGQAGTTARSSSSNIALLAALLFGGIAAGLTAWVFLGGKAPNQAASVSAPQATSNSSPTTASTAPAPTQATVSALPQTLSLPAASSPAAPQPSVAPGRSLFADPPTQAVNPVVPEPEKQPTASNNASTTPVAKPAPPVANKTLTVKQDTPNTSTTVASVKSSKEADTSLRIDKKISTSEVVAYAELPPEIRAELPALRLSGYMNAEQSSERLIAINDKLVRVGDEVLPGLQVMSLTASVVVMSYKGYRFRIAQ